MNEAIFTQLQKEMDQSVGALRKDLAKIRTGRASTALLEHIVVDYYGATTPLNQLATLECAGAASAGDTALRPQCHGKYRKSDSQVGPGTHPEQRR